MGLALVGFRPMVEMQFGDFITCGFNQIVNNLAKTHYRWNASLPIVIRAPMAVGSVPALFIRRALRPVHQRSWP